jgi:integration host factor subunit alpha
LKTITRKDLADAARDYVTPDDAKRLVNAVLDQISDALVADEVVKILKFGSFRVSAVSARIGRNPRAPSELHAIPEHRRVRFLAARELKERMARG